MNKWLKVMGFTVVLIGIGGAIAVNVLVDEKAIKERIQTSLEARTGRQVSLESISISFRPLPKLQIKNLQIFNPKEGTWNAPYTLKVQEAFIKINWEALTSKTPKIDSIQVDTAQIHYESIKGVKGAKDTHNWQFAPKVDPQEKGAGETPKSEAQSEQQWEQVVRERLEKLGLKEIKMSAVSVHWWSAKKSSVLMWETGVLELPSFKEGLSWKANLRWNDAPVQTEGRLENLSAWLGSEVGIKPSPLSMSFKVEQSTLSVKTKVDTTNPDVLVGQINLTSPKLSDFSKLLSKSFEPVPVSLKGEWKLTPLQVELTQAELTAGQTTVKGSGKGKRVSERAPWVWSAAIEGSELDLSRLMGKGGASGSGPTNSSGGARYVSNSPIPWQLLNTLPQMGLKVKMDKLILPSGTVMSGVQGAGQLSPGNINISALSLSTLGAQIQGSLTAASSEQLQLNINATGVPSDIMGTGSIKGGKMNVSVTGGGRGASIDDIISGFTGRAVVQIQGGQIDSKAAGGAALLINGMLPGLSGKGSALQVQCAAGALNFQQGQASGSPIMGIETDSLQILLNGALNLKSYQVDMGSQIAPKKGVDIGIGSLVQSGRIVGPINAPSVKIDPVQALASAGKIGAALGTGGLSILGDYVLKKSQMPDNACSAALGRATFNNAPAASGQAAPGQPPARQDGKKNTLDVLKGLKGLFK